MKKKVILRNKAVFLLSILTCLMLLPLNTEAEEPDDIEQLKKELRHTSGQEKLKILYDIVGCYYKISYDETCVYLAQYLELAQETHSLIDQARANSFYATIAFNQIEYHKVVNYTRKALKLYGDLGDSLNICRQYAKLSRVYVSLRESDSALQTIEIALKYFENHEHGLNLQSTKIQLGKAYYIGDRYTAAQEVLQEVVSETRNLNQHTYLAWALYWLGASNSKLGNFQEAIANFSESVENNKRVQNIIGKLGSMQQLGDMFLKIGEFANAYQLYFDCFQQKDIVRGYQGERQFTAEYHINLGKIYHNTQRYRSAIEQFDTAMRLIAPFDFSPTRGIIHNLIGQTSLSMNDPKAALLHFEQSYKFYQGISSRFYTAMTQNNIAEVYMYLNQYDTAFTYLQKAKLTNVEIHNKYGEALNRKNLAACYYNQGEFKEAMDELNAGMSYALQSSVDNLKLEYYSIYIMLCNQTTDCEMAQMYFKKFLQLSNTIAKQHTKNLTEFQLSTYTNELNTQTEFLNQTIELQNLEVNHNALQFQRLLLFTIVIILILFIIGILYYFNLRPPDLWSN